MKVWQTIRTGVAASIFVHLSALALLILFSEVHPFGAVTAEPVAVDIVTPDEVPQPKPDFSIPDPLFAQSPKTGEQETTKETSPGEASKETPPQQTPPPKEASRSEQPQKQSAQPQQQSAPKPPEQKQPEQKQAALQPAQPPSPPQVSPQQPSTLPAQIAAPIPQAPDLSVKYHVMLGLPQDRPGEVFDAPATQKADVGNNIAADFRRHLKSCSKLPSSISPTDQVWVKLRIVMQPDGRLAAEPLPIEGSASAKALALKESVVQALQACQPYDMLPVDRYAEWKVLDETFTPRDF